MTAINRLAAFTATAAGAVLFAQAAFAGPGCNQSGMTSSADTAGYQPAVYQLTPGDRSAARAYQVGMGYGHSVTSKAQAADIVDTASAAGSFNTLVSAVKAAGLVGTLKGDGPFTVFAPTDAAFAKLPPAQLAALLADKTSLTRVLTYHVVPGRVEAAEVVKLYSAATVEGQAVKIHIGDSVMVNNAKVLKTDIETSNGVIHVIDTVLLPPDMVSQR
jgi:uncharacterized surface protein with fasciclin (FAS1) repeats